MASLLYLKNSFNLSDEELVQRWAGFGLGFFSPNLDRRKMSG